MMARDAEIPRHEPDPEERGAELLAAVISGDEAATDELLAVLAPSLLKYLHRQMGQRLTRYLSVKDIAQESMASFLSSIDHLRANADLSDARNLLFQHARWIVMRRGSDAGKFAGESAYMKLASQDAAQPVDRSVGDVTLEDELVWLNEMIDALDEDLQVVVRRRLEGVTFGDLADELGLGESAIRKRFDRGLDELKRLGQGRKLG
jgi:DNA-directed RNA polymerase specialized sigma24 family protein